MGEKAAYIQQRQESDIYKTVMKASKKLSVRNNTGPAKQLLSTSHHYSHKDLGAHIHPDDEGELRIGRTAA